MISYNDLADTLAMSVNEHDILYGMELGNRMRSYNHGMISC